MQVWPRLRFADLARMPEDGRRFELYDGELSEVPSPVPRHQRVAFNVAEVLRGYERTNGGLFFVAPLDIVLDDYNVVQPDVVFFAPDRARAIDMRHAIRQAPDLAVEVLSPATEPTDRGRKLRLLARFGVREYWLIDLRDRTVELYTLDHDTLILVHVARGQETVASRALPSLVLDLAGTFAD